MFEHQKAAELLINAQCDVNAKRDDGYTPLILASGASYSGREMDSIVDLLIKKGADVNAKNKDGYNALMAASSAGNVLSAQLLIKAGAQVNEKDKRGRTALLLAKEESTEIVEMLEKAGAKE
jgi:ankyrin repeat protein